MANMTLQELEALKLKGVKVIGEKPVKTQSKSREGNIKTFRDGFMFDSITESKIYDHLKKLERAGGLDLVLTQMPLRFPVRKGERAASMVLDFMVIEPGGMEYVHFIDAKPFNRKTGKPRILKEWGFKKKMAEAVYPKIDIQILTLKDIL
jgi:hypothetical protein